MKAVVVVSYVNAARTLGRCLDAIQSQDCKDFDLMLVDGGSTDGSIEIARRRGVEPIILDGCSEPDGQTCGIQHSDAQVICLTNSDCYVPNDWVSNHLKWQQKGFDMVGGKLFWGGDDYGFSWSYWTPGEPNALLTSGLSLGFSNCSISRRIYDKVGGFKNLRSQHDMDFWIRATKAGGKLVLDPKIEVYHDHPMKSAVGSFRRSYGYAKNHVTLLRAAYGRGPWPNYASWPYSLYTLEELLLIRGVKVWKQQQKVASEHGINPSLLRFLWLRLLAFKIPNLVGWVSAMANPVGHVDNPNVQDAHKWGR
jgi:glycosyltransferase involved in cell wall biosynthesis